MYKLENNVQWTTDLKNAFKHGITKASIFYTDDENEVIEINESNNLMELTLEDNRYVPNMGIIGSATARKLEFKIHNPNGTHNLENKELTLKIGAVYNNSTYYINYGNFIVYDAPQTDETNDQTTIEAYDYMKKFDKPYVDTITYPCTLAQLLIDVCQQAEVDYNITNLAKIRNRAFSVQDNQFEGATLREVLQNIAKCAFSWCRINQSNQLVFDFLEDEQEPITETITIDEYKQDGFKKSSEYYGPVNRVIYADSNIEGQEEKVEDATSIQQNGLKELVIYDNLFAYTPERSQELIQAGSSLFGLTYMPVSQLDLIGFIYLDCNDIINIGTLNNETFSTRVFNHTIKYNGVTSDNVVTEGTSNNEEAYKNTANSVFQAQQTKVTVDRANKKIQQLVEENTQFQSRLVQVETTVDGISAEVDNMVDYRRETEGVTQVYLENAMNYDIMELEIKGNKTYPTNLYPGENLYPSASLYPNMEVADFDI